MKLLEQLRKKITGVLTGSCIVLFNPTTPIGTNQQWYTLEELSYQDTRWENRATTGHGWSYQWVEHTGFVLKPDRQGDSGQHRVGLRQAVYRSVVE